MRISQSARCTIEIIFLIFAVLFIALSCEDAMPESFKCPSCGAPLDVQSQSSATIRCPFCNTSVIVPAELRPSATSPKPANQAIGDLTETLQAVSEAALQGNKIDAIQLLRKLFPIGLKEAKEMVDALSLGQPVELPDQDRFYLEEKAVSSQVTHEPLGTSDSDNPLYNDVLRLLRVGQKIEAIRLYKQRVGCSLKEANIVVSQIEARHASVEGWKVAKKALVQTSIAGGAIGIVGCIIPVAITAVVLVFVLFMLTLPGGPLEGVWSRVNPFGFARLSLAFGSEGTGPGLFTDVRQAAVDNVKGNIYTADYHTGRVQAFDSQGKFLSLWVVDNNSDVIISGLAVDSQNRVYVSGSGKVYIYDGASGDELGIFTLPGDYSYAEDIFATSDGGLLVVIDSQTILRFNSNGELTLTIPEAISSITGDAETILHVATDGLGNIYAAAWNHVSVFKFDSGGRFITRFGSEGEEPGQFTVLHSIAVDGQGQVYVSDFDGIQVYDADGRYLRTFSVPGAVFDILFDDLDNFYAVSNDQKVFRYQLNQ
jgi:ribosomal protein L7/L12/sugar lactone lactonase YvrE